MTRPTATRLLPLCLTLAACAGGPATAQTAEPAGAPLDHVYRYEVPREAMAQAADTGVIRVSGSATVSVTPDRAQVSFAVVSESDDAADAAAKNATAMTAVLAAVRADGAPGLDVGTFGYGLTPVYTTVNEDGQRVQRIQGYRAVNNVRATTTDVDAVGGIIDAAIGAGANRVSGLGFEASNTDDARGEALRQAVERARAEAEIIAAALGRTLGPAIEVSGGAEVPRGGEMMMRMDAMSAADTPIEAGDQTVRAQVSITFAIGPATGRR